MKSLNKFIEETTKINEVDYSILQHLAIEYKENHLYSRKRVILEKYGVYDGCEELAKHIVELAKKDGYDTAVELTKDNLQDFKNIFFENIIVDIDTSENSGAEYIDNEELNKDLLFDEVVINVYLDKQHISELQSNIMHELTHAYNNYMMLLKGNKNYINVANSTLYKNIVTIPKHINAEYYIKKAMYLLLGYEKNAFIAQIKADLEKHKDKIYGPIDALNVLKQSDVYITYQRLNKGIKQYFNNDLSEEKIKEIEDAYIDITGQKMTRNKIFKKLQALSNKTMKKLDKTLPKMCIESLNNVLITDDKCMTTYLNGINECNIY